MSRIDIVARASGIAVLAAIAWIAQPGFAQPTGQIAIEDLFQQVQEMQRELEVLRQRDEDRQEWEDSIIERLPDLDDERPPAVFPQEELADGGGGVDIDEVDDEEIEVFLTPLSSDCGNITWKPGARIQSRYLYDDFLGNNDFFIRRFRLKSGGNAFDLASYYMELKIDSTAKINTDPSPDAVVENAWLDFELLHETHYLRVGLYDIPFSRNALTSDSKLLFMDRTLIKNQLTTLGMADNTVGMLWHGRPFCGHLEYSVGVFDNVKFERFGDPAFAKNSDELMPAGRIVLHLLDPPTSTAGYADYRESYIGEGRRLAIGANAAYLGSASDNAIGPDRFEVQAYGVDLFYNSGPFVFQAEYDRFERNRAGADLKGDGWYAQAGYIVCCYDCSHCYYPCHPVLELAVRHEELDPEERVFGDRLRWNAVGANLYIREHNLKIQADYTFKHEEIVQIDNDVFQVQLQFDF